MKTCALCRHCYISLGSEGWSDLTPASAGSASCEKDVKEFPADVDLVRMAQVGSACPKFKLLEIPE